MSNLNYKQASNVERRSWDRELYESKAKARAAAADAALVGRPSKVQRFDMAEVEGKGAASSVTSSILKQIEGETGQEEFTPAESGRSGPENSQRAFLKARSRRVDLDSKVGTTEIISEEQAAKTKGVAEAKVGVSVSDGVVKSATGVGWHCKVCDCFLKDSLTYLDHINGRKHQRFLGYSMRAEKSTIDDVKAKMAQLAESRSVGNGKKGKDVRDNSNEGENSDFNVEPTYDDTIKAREEEILRRKEERARKREERKKRVAEEEEEDDTIDPDMAAILGFGSFGGGKK